MTRGSGNEGWRWSWSWRGGSTRRRLPASKRACRRRSVVGAGESGTRLREGSTMAANNNGGKRMRASVGLLAACAGVLVAARAEAAGPKIGLSLPTQREERWVKDRQTMEAEAKKAGIELRVQVTDNDASKQVAQCENLISRSEEHTSELQSPCNLVCRL